MICFASFGRFSAERASFCGIVFVQRSSEKPQWGRGAWATAASQNNAVQQSCCRAGIVRAPIGTCEDVSWWYPYGSIHGYLFELSSYHMAYPECNQQQDSHGHEGHGFAYTTTRTSPVVKITIAGRRRSRAFHHVFYDQQHAKKKVRFLF